MALHAVKRRSLPDEVFEQLTGEIVSGRYAPGAPIPSERQLSEVLRVNRHVVREAVKRLKQVGLVEVAQGGRTTVLDYRQSAGLDLLAIVAEHADVPDGPVPLLAAALEMRAGIGAEVARLCAQRSDGRVRDELVQTAERLAQVAHGGELLALDQAFWQCVLDGAANVAYQLAFNSLIRATHAHPDIAVPWLEQELRRGDFRRPIAKAIAAGSTEAAASATRDALTPPEGFPTLGQPHIARRARR